MVFLSQPARNEADHAHVPAAARQYERRITVRIELLFDLLRRRQTDAPLQTLAAAVELVNVLGQLLGSLARIGREQFDGQLRLAKTAGSIQTRGQAKSKVLAAQ